MLSDLACRSVVRLSGWIVPPSFRGGWLDRWCSCLAALRILIDRGEFPGDAAAQMGWFCGGVFADACRLRCVRFEFHRFAGGPALLAVCGAGLLPIFGACTRGFAVTRAILAKGGDHLIPYVLPVVFAFLSSIAIVVFARLPLHVRNWRYWSFLLLKTACLMTIATLLWIEGGFAVRRLIANEAARVLIGGLILAAVFVAGFAWSVLWSLSDQQRRCPVCLRRMAMPVRIGSWSSVFEPVTTELICEEGHGSLCIQETEIGEPDRWYALSSP